MTFIVLVLNTIHATDSPKVKLAKSTLNSFYQNLCLIFQLENVLQSSHSHGLKETLKFLNQTAVDTTNKNSEQTFSIWQDKIQTSQ